MKLCGPTLNDFSLRYFRLRQRPQVAFAQLRPVRLARVGEGLNGCFVGKLGPRGTEDVHQLRPEIGRGINEMKRKEFRVVCGDL